MDSLPRLALDVGSCRLCPRLVAWREQVAVDKRAAFRDEEYWGRGVPGFGDPHAKVLVFGLAPAAHGANRTGRVFTGDRSGDWLYRAMHRAGLANKAQSVSIDDGLALSGAWVTAVVKCAPPDNKPLPGERANCRPFLQRELALLSGVTVVVCLGAFAYEAVCAEFGVRPRPKFGHGIEVVAPNGMHLLCSFHPSQQNTFTGRLTEPMLDAVFTRAVELTCLDGSAVGDAKLGRPRGGFCMDKQVISADVPTTGGPFNLCVRYGDMVYVSGLPPFDVEYSARLRAARAAGEPIPPFPPTPFDVQARCVMEHLKLLVEAAGSNMDCLLKVVVWLKDQSDQEAFDRIYRSYFSSDESLPTRTRMQAGRTPMDCGLEIDAIGFVPG